MNRLCNSKRDCTGQDDPLTDFMSEQREQNVSVATQTQTFMPPPLGSNFISSNCYSVAIGETDEEAAGNALSDVVDCIAAHGLVPPTQIIPDPPGTPPENRDPNVFRNSAQTCTTLCPDGLPFTFVVAAGRFSGFNQDQVDEMAHTYACSKVIAARVCIGNLTNPECCLGHPFSAPVTADGVGTFSILNGSLPNGLTLSQTSPKTAVISGTPTTVGNFVFTLRITDSNGDYMDKVFQMRTVGILTTSLPSVQELNSYSAQIVGSGNTFGSAVWSIVSGSLPPGVTFNTATQAFSGTATTRGTYTFTVQMSDGIAACQKTYTISVIPCLDFVPTQPLHWYDADQLPFNNNDMMDFWYDVGRGLADNNPLGGFASATYPIFHTNALNGKPIVRWTKPNEAKVLTAQLPSAIPQVNTPYAGWLTNMSCCDFFCVGNCRSGGNGQMMINATMLLPGSGGFRCLYKSTLVPANVFRVDLKRTNPGLVITSVSTTFTPVDGEFNMYHVKIDWGNGRVTININGTNYVTNSPLPDTGLSERNTDGFVPSDTTEDVDMAEMVIFDSNLDQTTIDKMFGYLAWKWGLQTKLPSTHPYRNSTPCLL